jgi:two-component system alkaline phosphatase synthesis response regulator PhoP
MSKILIAEDDLQIASLIVLAFSRRGHEVFHAPDGARTLELAVEQPLDLILLDVMMPVMTGLEVLDRLQDDAALKRIPVVILSARSRDADIRAGLAAGAVDYVTKPFSLRELVARAEANLAPSAVPQPPS